MSLSNDNVAAFLLDINRIIEEYADGAVKHIIRDRNFDFLIYPPNNGFSDAEKKELLKLENNEDLKNALRKVIADSSAGVVFDMLNHLDGTSTPQLNADQWTGLKLVDEEDDPDADAFDGQLHDSFFDAYWEWRDLRENKDWKLDTYEG